MKRVPRHVLEVAALETNDEGAVTRLHARSQTGPVPLLHRTEHRWLRFDEVLIERDSRGLYWHRYSLEGVVVFMKLHRPPPMLARAPADLLAQPTIWRWRQSELVVRVPRGGGVADEYRYRAGARRARPGQPALLLP